MSPMGAMNLAAFRRLKPAGRYSRPLCWPVAGQSKWRRLPQHAPIVGRVVSPQISIKIDVHPSTGMDEESLARRVASRIEDGIASASRNVQEDTGIETYG